jgi:hypothetical protein
VQDRRNQHLDVVHPPHAGDQHGNLDQVIDVGLGVRPLAPLGGVPLCGKVERFQEPRQDHSCRD